MEMERLTVEEFVGKIKTSPKWAIAFGNTDGEVKIVVNNAELNTIELFQGPDPTMMNGREYNDYLSAVMDAMFDVMNRAAVMERLRRVTRHYETVQTPEEFTLLDREIIPVKENLFGVVVTRQEAGDFLQKGYNVRGVRLAGKEDLLYYLAVHVGSYERKAGFNQAMLETAGYADVVIHPQPWKTTTRSGIKAYVRTARIRPR